MAIVPFHIVDVFSDQPFGGNPAAVIPNAASLSEIEMLQITDELSMEAGFVLPPESPRADPEAAVLHASPRGCDQLPCRDRGDGLARRSRLLPAHARRRDDPARHRCGSAAHRPCSPRGAGRVRYRITLPGPRFGEPVPPAEVAEALSLPADLLQTGGPRAAARLLRIRPDRRAGLGPAGDAGLRQPRGGAAGDRRPARRGGPGARLSRDAPWRGGFPLPFLLRRRGRIGGHRQRHQSGRHRGLAGRPPDRAGDTGSADRHGAGTRARPADAGRTGGPNCRGGRWRACKLATTGVVVMRGAFHFGRKSLIAGA